MKLNDIRDNAGARKGRVRVGRGIGSGKGKTSARGQKGQKARSGVAIKGFEGGQMPLHMRLPKRGFNNPFGKDYAEVNVGMIQKFIDAGKLDAKATITEEALRAAGLVRGGKDGVRLLGKGEITAKATFAVTGGALPAGLKLDPATGTITGTPSATGPIMAPMRSFISRAALLVKVTARIWDGKARRVERMCASRVVRTRVLPVPAPASTSSGPSRRSTAARCGRFSRSR